MKSESEKDKASNVIEYTSSIYSSSNQTVVVLGGILTALGLIGAVWSLPFPHLAFLGRYNGFVNWASFLIAFAIYYYYTLSPVVSYGLLLVIFAFAAIIVSLEKLQAIGWPPVGVICVLILGAGILLQQVSTSKYSGRINRFLLLLYTPFYLMYTLFKQLKVIR
jgi:hypothetical protein